MNEEELKAVLEDPKKILDMFRVFHQLIHVYEAQEAKKARENGTNVVMGLSDTIDIQLIKNQEVKQ